MKSYQKHLTDTKSFGENLPINYRPTMRSSAIFPLIVQKDKIDSVYTFMGYWLRKRNIKLVTALINIRNELGDKIKILNYEINSTKTYVLRGKDFFSKVPKLFYGSLEIEIFSGVDMVFPYPTITFALRGLNGMTFVHTSGRVYNNFDDLKSNSEVDVAETGFDILVGKDYSPFFSFVNGPIPIKKSTLEIELIDHNDNHLLQKRKIKNIPPYGLVWINILKKNFNFKKLVGTKLTVKIKHNLKGFFPRFICGNIYRNFSDISLTHSYYDNSTVNEPDSVYKNPSKISFYDSIFAIPFDQSFDDIELAIYPNFSFSPTTLSFELFDFDGNFIKTSQTKIRISDGSNKLIYLSVFKLFKNSELLSKKGMVKVIVDGNGAVPSRMKFGLNLSKVKKKNNLPSNICFNAIVPNKKYLHKPGTFRWCPIFSSSFQKIYLHNTSFVKKGFGNAKLKLELCREIDSNKLKWTINLKENCSIEIINKKSKKISLFLKGSIGWITIQSSIPFISGYYVTDFNKGVIGADHIF